MPHKKSEDSKLKILIVEDEVISRKILEEILKPYGVCLLAANGQQAFMKFRSAHDQGEPFDLVCLDIMMPEICGEEVLRGIREYEAGKGMAPESATKVLVTSALIDADNRFGAKSEGSEDYIMKPVDRDKVLRALKQLDLVK